jgi:dTDP-glucose 4,6-dehydratase
MNLLVTGGAGFIGANFVNFWLGRHAGDSITVVDKLTYAGDRRRLAVSEKTGRMTFVNSDIQDIDAMRSAMKGIDVVVHFAAETHVDRSLAGFDAEKLFMRVNVEGTYSLLHAAKESGVKRFHHVSTDEVFGDLEYGKPDKFHENFPYGAHNPYSISKAAADFAVRGFSRSYGLDFTLSNCTNNYGPFQTPEKVIPRSISLLLQDKKIQLYTDANGVPGPNIRDWLYVEDHCAAIEAIILKGRIGETYCIGGNCELTNSDLIKRILPIMSGITGKKYTFESNVEFVKDRPGHDKRYAMETSKIEKDLGWKPAHSFETGIQSTINWYLSQEGKEWLKSLEKATSEVRKEQGKRVVNA